MEVKSLITAVLLYNLVKFTFLLSITKFNCIFVTRKTVVFLFKYNHIDLFDGVYLLVYECECVLNVYGVILLVKQETSSLCFYIYDKEIWMQIYMNKTSILHLETN
jgi:hypothetical protein